METPKLYYLCTSLLIVVLALRVVTAALGAA
jgi:hypothetical protein